MSAISKTKICNLALGQIGDESISDFDSEDSVVARRCRRFYDEVRDDILCDGLWTFAQKRKALGLLDEDPIYTDDGVTLVYAKPSDYLRLNFVNVEYALIKVEGTKILSNTADLAIKYTFRNDDPATYFPKFTMALATRLAAEMAFPATSSRSLAENLFKVYYDKKLPQALSADSQQSGTPLAPIQDAWTSARIEGGSTGLVGRSGADTWYPCCC